MVINDRNFIRFACRILTIQDTMDVINFIALPSYLYAILGTLVISWVISKIISLRIKHIDMVSSLKAND